MASLSLVLIGVLVGIAVVVVWRASHKKVETTTTVNSLAPRTAAPSSQASGREHRADELNPSTGEQSSVTGHSDEVTHVAFSADGSQLVSAGKLEFIISSVGQRRELRRIGGLPSRSGKDVSFSADRRFAALNDSGHGASLEMWDLTEGRRVARYQEPDATHSKEAFQKHIGISSGIASSWDGGLIAAGCSRHTSYGYDNGVRIWRARDLKPIREFGWTAFGTVRAAFLPDNKTLLLAVKELSLWNAETGAELRRFPASDGKTAWLTLCGAGHTAITKSEDAINVWNLEAGKETSRIPLHSADRLASLAISYDGELVSMGYWADNGIAKVATWYSRTGSKAFEFEHGKSVKAIAFSPDGRQIAIGDSKGGVTFHTVPANVSGAPPNSEAARSAQKSLEAQQAAELEIGTLRSALRTLDRKKVLAILQQNPRLALLESDPPLLVTSAENGWPEVVRALIEMGAGVNIAGRRSDTALQLASRYGQEQVVELLLDAGADVNAADADGWTPLHHAAAGHNSKTLDESAKNRIVERLIRAGAALNKRSAQNTTALDIANGWDHKRIAETLKTGVART